MEAILKPSTVYCHLMFIKIIREKVVGTKYEIQCINYKLKWIIIGKEVLRQYIVHLAHHLEQKQYFLAIWPATSVEDRKMPHLPSVLSKPVVL